MINVCLKVCSDNSIAPFYIENHSIIDYAVYIMQLAGCSTKESLFAEYVSTMISLGNPCETLLTIIAENITSNAIILHDHMGPVA